MIPVRTHRVIIVLLGISALLAGVDAGLTALGLRGVALQLCTGLFAGFVVYLMAMEGGRTLCFCAKGLVKPEYISSDVSELMNKAGGGKLGIRVSPIMSDSLFAVTVREGRHCRTFVSRGLLVRFSQDAIRGVAAHECGHVISKHPTRLALLLGLIAGVKLSIGIPLFSSIAILLAFLWMLREWEFIADHQAVSLVGVESLEAAFHEYQTVSGDKAEVHFLSELLSGHPSIARRLKHIEVATNLNVKLRR